MHGSPSRLSFVDKSIQNVLLYFDCPPDPYHSTFEESRILMNNVLKGICNVKALKLSPAFLEFLLLAVPEQECFSASFYNLKSLYVTVDEYDQSIIRLLNCSPNLEVLSICFKWWDGWSDSMKMPNEDISCLTYHLRKIELFHVVGNNNELELIQFLLKNGHVLQEMSIYWREILKNPNEITSEVMKFPDVVLTFFKHESDIFFLQPYE